MTHTWKCYQLLTKGVNEIIEISVLLLLRIEGITFPLHHHDEILEFSLSSIGVHRAKHG